MKKNRNTRFKKIRDSSFNKKAIKNESVKNEETDTSKKSKTMKMNHSVDIVDKAPLNLRRRIIAGEKLKESTEKSFRKEKISYQKFNFDEEKKSTRTKDKAKNSKKEKKQKNAFKKEEKKISKLKNKKEKLDKKLKFENKDNSIYKSSSKANLALASYLSQGKDENAAVDGTYKVLKTTGATGKILTDRKQRKRRRLKSKQAKLKNKIDKRERNLFYKKNLSEFKKTEDYKKSSKIKQFIKRRRYKKEVNKRYKNSVQNKLKKYSKETMKKFAEYIKHRNKKILISILFVVMAGFFLSNIANSVMNMFVGVTSNTLSTNYLSSKDTLTTANQEFLSYEYALQDEIDNIETNYPDYDEYEIKGDGVGHDVNELLSFLTATKGNFEVNGELKAELKRIFNKMYQKKYTSRTITKYDSEGEPYDYTILTLMISKKSIDEIAKEELKDFEDNLIHYKALLEASGGMGEYFGSSNGDLSEIVNNPDFHNPGLKFTSEKVKALFNEAEKHIGKRYVFGGNGPANFDCSSFVCWSFTKSGVKNMPRTTAQAIFDVYCNKIPVSEARAGDIVFFSGTYDSGSAISHVGIYAGGGYMIHAGDPIKYVNLNNKYWKEHFYTFGRLKE